jgi:hypothetical protein
MESDSLQVRTYVNGTLYSVLVRASLKERAREIGLPDSLNALIEHSDETLARQINYILEQLESPAPDEKEHSDNEEEEEEEEDVEDEEEDDDPADEEEVDLFVETGMTLEPTGGASGEELLCSRYIAGVTEAQAEAVQIRASIDEGERVRASRAGSRGQDAAPEDPEGAAPRRRMHRADEPLQRPATPKAPGATTHVPTPAATPAPPSAPPVPDADADADPEAPATEQQQQQPIAVAPAAPETPGDPEYEAAFGGRSKVPRTPQVKT